MTRPPQYYRMRHGTRPDWEEGHSPLKEWIPDASLQESCFSSTKYAIQLVKTAQFYQPS